MESRRQFIRKSIFATVGAAASAQIINAGNYEKNDMDRINAGSAIDIPKKDWHKPLDSIEFSVNAEGTLKILDAKGREYYSSKKKKDCFTISGALGYHIAVLSDKKGNISDIAVFKVTCKSEVKDASGTYEHMLFLLLEHMTRAYHSDFYPIGINNTIYRGYVNTSRDHILGLKGMKYFYDPHREWLDAYADNQCENGMIWDIFSPRAETSYFEFQFPPGFHKLMDNGKAVFGRQPVMNDVEHTFVQGIHHIWKITGDDDWMKSRLDTCIRALNYSMTSPYMWSEKFQLIKRTLTPDLWDFQSKYDTQLVNGNIMMTVPGNPNFGAVSCDNIGTFYSCNLLAEMLEYAGRNKEADEYRQIGKGILERLEKIAWNGEFYVNHIPENPDFKRDMGVDISRQVTLSNAYALNRGITHEKAVAIIKTYQRLKEETKEFATAEWFTVYPPFEKGFHIEKWHYVNGGVAPMVAGELAHGAFEHGFEEYGVDILNRVAELGKKYEKIPDVWYGIKPEVPRRNFYTIDMRKAANTDFSGTSSVAGAIPWTQEGENDLHEFPVTQKVFEHVEFDIIDPAANSRRACLGISPERPYKKTETFAVNKKTQSLYLLHTMSGGNIAGIFEVEYNDSSIYQEYIVKGNQIESWWLPYRSKIEFSTPSSRIAWKGKNAKVCDIGIMIWGWNNPHPDKIIKNITFRASLEKSKWFILGITLTDAPVFIMPTGLSLGIPAPWSLGAVVYALMEGLCGLYNTGTNFSRLRFAPRWTASAERKATVCAKHETTGGYARYSYEWKDSVLAFELATCAKEQEVEILIPHGQTVEKIEVNNIPVQYEFRNIESSRYVVFGLKGIDCKKIIVHLK